MAIRSFSDIVLSMLNFLRRLRPRVDTKEGTFTRDVIIDAPASEFSTFYSALENVSNSQSPDLATAQALTNLARNLQAPRRGTVRASGTVIFYRVSAPPGTIQIPRGTIVSSKGSLTVSPRQFVTTQDASLSIVNFNAETARFEVEVPIRSVLGGADSNVPAGAISVLVTPIANVVGCYNRSSTTGGQDRESDLACANRIKQIFLGNNVGTESGYYLTLMNNVNITDVKVVGPNDTTLVKRSSAGTIDILIRGAVATQPPIEEYVYTTSTAYYIPLKQPFFTVGSSSFIVNGSVSGQLTQGIDYAVSYDSGIYGGSIYATDKFNFLHSLSNGESLTFTYSYNSLIEDAQTILDSNTGKIVTADVLVKAAKQRLINVTAIITLLAGYTADATITSVQAALSTHLNEYAIGEEVQQSDIIAIIANVTGVDSVNVPLTTLAEDITTGNIVQDVNGNLIIPADSYAVSGTITILVQS